ncbi:insulinase family protein [Marispirochaeta sp.]|uniref:insulinase family protein n=1 Tax=Marispirochaeta sp. TaxID=2038653 RepID=UPI0029C7D76E|nr:insulinase family protein [Marispirochaeta sp.]
MKIQHGQSIHGFRIESVSDLPEFRGRGISARHEATGLEIFHLYNDDPENLFSFIFKTPPRDNSGVAHIVEHAVLAGSKRFPIKDPFLVLLKGSLNTFLNAMTYPDKTVYPGASTVPKDYYNLMTVYGDAVFFPMLKKEIFLQEGVRLQPSNEGLELSGVVFNEMQGNYSSFESVVGEWSYRGLFPDSSYGYDSGGEPQAIRELRYEDFLKFHSDYYHPSNCRVFLYGNIPTEEQLAFLQEQFLSAFDGPRKVDASISMEPDWAAPRTLTVNAPAGSGDDDSRENGASVLVSWRLKNVDDPEYLLTWEVLAEILLGNPGSPLYKALMDSRLGEDLSPSCGLDSELRDLVFSAGLRGMDPDKREMLEETIFGLLKNLAAEGIPEEFREAALARIDFRHREIRGGVPFGLRLMGRALRGWLHGHKPEATMRYEEVIASFKERLQREPDYFSRLIKEELIENSNRVVVTIRPDDQYYLHNEEDEQDWLSRRKSELGSEGIAKLEEDYHRMTIFQETPDKAEELAKVPCVTIDDLPRDVRKYSLEDRLLDSSKVGTVPVSLHETFCNGVVYLDLAIDISGLEQDEYLLLPYFSKYLCNTGYPGVSYDRVATLLSRHSGGFYSFLEASDRIDAPEDPALFLYFRIKALEDELPRTLEIIGRLLNTGILDDRQRLKEELLELRNDMRSAVVSSGHSFASLRASRGFSKVLSLEEAWRGIEQFLYINALSTDFDDSWKNLSKRMSRLRKKILSRERMLLNLTADTGSLERIEPAVTGFFAGFSSAGEKKKPRELSDVAAVPKYQALVIPTTVNYAAQVFPSSRLGDTEHPYEDLLAHILKVESLWEKIRMQGGAYGAFASVNATEGVFSMASYRDPHTFRTLQAFRDSLSELTRGVDPLLLEKSIISVVGRELRPLSPGEKGMLAFRRRLYCISDEERQKKRDTILSAAPADIRRAAERLIAALDENAKAVLVTSKEGWQEALEHIPDLAANYLTLPV